ncbi:MAG: hypothetical protein D6725_11590 [Planctomycetota bacterium]|nr:MAG: hypothetical protein D6725_11590 [Planctomycetota bacterium]
MCDHPGSANNRPDPLDVDGAVRGDPIRIAMCHRRTPSLQPVTSVPFPEAFPVRSRRAPFDIDAMAKAFRGLNRAGRMRFVPIHRLFPTLAGSVGDHVRIATAAAARRGRQTVSASPSGAWIA